MTTIEGQVFDNCSGFTDIVVRWTTPLVPVWTIFHDVDLSTKTLHVPVGSKALYEADPVWGSFGTIIEDAHLHSAGGVTGDENMSAGSTEVWLQGSILHVNTPVAEDVRVYSLSGSILYQAKKPAGAAAFDIGGLPGGILIVRSSSWSQKVIKN